MKKICRCCGIEKDISYFYKHPEMSDGYLNHCKDCVRMRMYNYRLKNVDLIRIKDRIRGKARVLNEREIRLARQRIFRTPEKGRARNRSSKASNRPERCPICGRDGKIHGHHLDYSKPNIVVWCCPICHSAIHYNRIAIEDWMIQEAM